MRYVEREGQVNEKQGSLTGTSLATLKKNKKKGTHGETYINASGGSSRIVKTNFWACSPGGLEMQR